MNAREFREKTVRDAKAGLILDAAMRVFARDGYYGTRLEEIAVQAGFSKAALYNYFPNKEAIFLHLAVREYDRLFEMVSAVVDPAAPLSRNIEGVARTVLQLCGEHFALLLEISDPPCMNMGEIETLARQHGELFNDLKARLTEMNEVMIAFLAAARARGELASPLSDQALASMLGAQIRGVLFDWKLKGSRGDIAAEVAQVQELVLHGVRACREPGSAQQKASESR